MPYDPMNQVHPGPLEGIDRIPAAPGSPASAAPGDASGPIKLVHLAVAEEGGLRFITGRKLPDGIESCELYAMPDYGRAPAELFLAPAAVDTPPRFTISASDRFELTGAVGLLRGYDCAGAADALQRVLDAESASFSVQGEDDARDAGRYRAWRHAAVNDNTKFLDAALEYQNKKFADPKNPTPDEFDAGIDYACAAIAAQQGNKTGTNSGHGHVWDRPDGLKARCGGPGICSQCSRDQAAQQGKGGEA
ncbi:hypothetical protein [Bordetella genomosp. 6]|nr:hypothetical protein [Bordetella genomosp. 6]